MLAVSAAAAHAETPAPTPDPAPVPSVQRAAKPISDTDLQDLSGGQAAAVNDQQLKAVTSDNSVNALGNITNGPVTLNAGAFSGFSGLGNFVVNTGNNNTLQGSMSVTIVMTPAP
jgi:hypothetical protein